MTSRVCRPSVGRHFRRHARCNCGQASIMDKVDGFSDRQTLWPALMRSARQVQRRRRRRKMRKTEWVHYDDDHEQIGTIIRTVRNVDVIDVDILCNRRQTRHYKQQQQQQQQRSRDVTRQLDQVTGFNTINVAHFTDISHPTQSLSNNNQNKIHKTNCIGCNK